MNCNSNNLIKNVLCIWKVILTLSNHPGKWFVVVFPKHLARQVRWINSGLSNGGMILRNFRANQFNLKLISISLVGNTIAFLVCLHFLPFTTYDRLHAVVRVSPPRDLWMHMHFILQSTQLQHELHNHTYGSSRRKNHYPTSCYIKFLAVSYFITRPVSKVS